MEFILSNLSMILLVVAVISTTVSILTQFTKDIGFLNKIPTRLQVLVLAVGITVTTFVAICQYKHYIITWYSIFASVIMGFLLHISLQMDGMPLLNYLSVFIRKKMILSKMERGIIYGNL